MIPIINVVIGVFQTMTSSKLFIYYSCKRISNKLLQMTYCLCGLIVRVRVVPRRTVVGDIDRRFDNLSGSHHQSHVNCVSSVYGIYVSGQLSRDVIGCFKSNRWLGRDVIGCWFGRLCCFWLWRLLGPQPITVRVSVHTVRRLPSVLSYVKQPRTMNVDLKAISRLVHGYLQF